MRVSRAFYPAIDKLHLLVFTYNDPTTGCYVANEYEHKKCKEKTIPSIVSFKNNLDIIRYPRICLQHFKNSRESRNLDHSIQLGEAGKFEDAIEWREFKKLKRYARYQINQEPRGEIFASYHLFVADKFKVFIIVGAVEHNYDV